MSPYQNFRQRPINIFIEQESPAGQRPTIIDTDGATLYEEFGFPLRRAIIEHDDTAALKKYLENAPWAIKRGHPLGMDSDPFIVAATHGSLDSLRILLDHYAHFMKPKGKTDLDDRCCDALNTAARFGQLEVVKLLLDHPLLLIDIHHNNHGFTPIMAAADAFGWAGYPFDWKDNLEGKEAVINFLLDRGAHALDADYVWDFCDNPMTGEPKDKRIPIFMVLNLAAEWAGPDLIRRLIQSGADPNTKIMENKDVSVRTDITIISTASRCANLGALKVLLDCAGKVGEVADAVSYRDSWGSMPLHWACQVSTKENPREVAEEVMVEKPQRIMTIVDLLLSCNPETINKKDMYGNTPLHYAAKTYSNCGKEYTSILRSLCNRGADASIINKTSETALHCLCQDNGGWPIDAAAVKFLLGHGAMVTDSDDDGNTPLHLAVKNLENLDALEFLLDHGADISVKNLKGNTPLHEAADGMFWPGVVEEKYKPMGEILRRLQGDGGCLMDELNTEGKSPRQIQNERRNKFMEQIDDIENKWRRWGL